MEDPTFEELRRQINNTKVMLNDREVFGKNSEEDVTDIILKNQLAIMKVIGKIYDDMLTIPR